VRRARAGRLVPLDALEDPPEAAVDPVPPSDPGLRRAILECLAHLPRRAGQVLRLRLTEGHRAPDRDLARELEMKTNTFLQHVVRARRALARCLAEHGVPGWERAR